jgi:hypothetical protein
MIDASPGLCPNNIYDLEDDVSIIPNTKELFEEQDEKKNVEARSKIKLLSPPTEEALPVLKHCDVALWSPLQDIMWTTIPSNQYLLPVAQLVPYTQLYSQCGTGLQELIQQNLQHTEIFCLLCLTILWCLNSKEGNNKPPTTQTSGDIGAGRIMELDPGPMENDDTSDSCGTGTMCCDLVPSYLVPSDHLISAFQQGHQAFPLVKLKDNFTDALDNAYCSILPMVPIHPDHIFAQYPTFICTQL